MKTAMYLRISSEDEDLRTGEKNESESISNQRSLLREYVSGHAELVGSEILEFCDDGWSGTNFERPAVKALLEQVRRGQVNCIVVKDLSRFGRDYLTVGDYISRVFPFLGVRFISVNDGFDSSNPLDIDSLDTSFRTLIYDLYSRDLSRRVKSAKRARAERGRFSVPMRLTDMSKTRRTRIICWWIRKPLTWYGASFKWRQTAQKHGRLRRR